MQRRRAIGMSWKKYSKNIEIRKRSKILCRSRWIHNNRGYLSKGTTAKTDLNQKSPIKRCDLYQKFSQNPWTVRTLSRPKVLIWIHSWLYNYYVILGRGCRVGHTNYLWFGMDLLVNKNDTLYHVLKSFSFSGLTRYVDCLDRNCGTTFNATKPITDLDVHAYDHRMNLWMYWLACNNIEGQWL